MNTLVCFWDNPTTQARTFLVAPREAEIVRSQLLSTLNVDNISLDCRMLFIFQ